jgi:hypothetical protein
MMQISKDYVAFVSHSAEPSKFRIAHDFFVERMVACGITYLHNLKRDIVSPAHNPGGKEWVNFPKVPIK